MKKAQSKKIGFFFALIGLLLLSTACIPNEYQGLYREARTGATLKLEGTKATFVDADGRSLVANKSPLKFKELIKAKEGLFTRDNPLDKNLTEIYWVRPDSRSVQSAEGLTWYNAEVIHLRVRKDLHDKVQDIELVHSLNGSVILDTPSESVQVGWPAGTEILDMRRVQE